MYAHFIILFVSFILLYYMVDEWIEMLHTHPNDEVKMFVNISEN